MALVQHCGKGGKGSLHPQRGMEGTQHVVFAGQWDPKQGGTAVLGDLGDEAFDLVHFCYYLGEALVEDGVDFLRVLHPAQSRYALDASDQHSRILAFPDHLLLAG